MLKNKSNTFSKAMLPLFLILAASALRAEQGQEFEVRSVPTGAGWDDMYNVSKDDVNTDNSNGLVPPCDSWSSKYIPVESQLKNRSKDNPYLVKVREKTTEIDKKIEEDAEVEFYKQKISDLLEKWNADFRVRELSANDGKEIDLKVKEYPPHVLLLQKEKERLEHSSKFLENYLDYYELNPKRDCRSTWKIRILKKILDWASKTCPLTSNIVPTSMKFDELSRHMEKLKERGGVEHIDSLSQEDKDKLIELKKEFDQFMSFFVEISSEKGKIETELADANPGSIFDEFENNNTETPSIASRIFDATLCGMIVGKIRNLFS